MNDTTPTCCIPDCLLPRDRLGFCTRHYMRNRRHGDPTKGRRNRGEIVDFVANVVLTNTEKETCLEWPFYVNERTGYAQTKLEGKLRLVHRYACEKVHGAPPSAGFHAAHSCGNRRCVNPMHIAWKTPLENAADKVLHGTDSAGERNPNAKLTDDEVIAIRVLRGRMPASEIARLFRTTKSAISSIQLRKSRVTPANRIV